VLAVKLGVLEAEFLDAFESRFELEVAEGVALDAERDAGAEVGFFLGPERTRKDQAAGGRGGGLKKLRREGLREADMTWSSESAGCGYCRRSALRKPDGLQKGPTQKPQAAASACGLTLVPTLCVGTPSSTLCVV